MIEKLSRDEADFVIGSRYVTGGKTEDWSRLRWLNSAGATVLAKPLVGTVKDPMAGFFAFQRESLRNADALNPIGYKIGLELIAKMQISPNRVAEVPITFRNRIHGESKLTMKEQFKYLEHLSRLYDYTFPKASPRLKFLVAAAAGTAVCAAAIIALQLANMPFPLSIAVGLIGMIAVTFAFFVRYVRTQRAFLLMKRPFSEFAMISLGEFLAGWVFAVSTQASILVQTCVGLAALLLVRYTLRKVFLHDLRGIRGTPTENATRRLRLAPRAQSTAASA